MTQYVVHSGSLTIAISAETAYDAAIEALQWWGDSPIIQANDECRLCLDASRCSLLNLRVACPFARRRAESRVAEKAIRLDG